MNLKVNDHISIDGKQSRIKAIFGAGAHLNFVLDDGRSFTDLHKNPALIIVSQETTTSNSDFHITKKIQFPGLKPKKAGEDESQG